MRREAKFLLLALLATGACGDAASAPRGGAPAVEMKACGGGGQPDCPLQGWMRATLQPYTLGGGAQIHARLAPALDKLAEAAPQGYPDWASISRAGAAAARRQDLAGVKASCVACHDAYRGRYRETDRGRRLF